MSYLLHSFLSNCSHYPCPINLNAGRRARLPRERGYGSAAKRFLPPQNVGPGDRVLYGRI